MKKDKSICLTVIYPRAAVGKQELSRRAAGIHAEFVLHRLKTMTCPADQKTDLLDSVIRIVSQNRERK